MSSPATSPGLLRPPPPWTTPSPSTYLCAALLEAPLQTFLRPDRLGRVADPGPGPRPGTASAEDAHGSGGDFVTVEHRAAKSRAAARPRRPLYWRGRAGGPRDGGGGHRGPPWGGANWSQSSNFRRSWPSFFGTGNAWHGGGGPRRYNSERRADPTIGVNQELGDPVVTLDLTKLQRSALGQAREPAADLLAEIARARVIVAAAAAPPLRTEVLRAARPANPAPIPRVAPVLDTAATPAEEALAAYVAEHRTAWVEAATTTDAPPNHLVMTDALLAVLFTMHVSVYPWQIAVRRIGTALVFARHGSVGAAAGTRSLVCPAVSENAADGPEDADPLNAPPKLAAEAAEIERGLALLAGGPAGGGGAEIWTLPQATIAAGADLAIAAAPALGTERVALHALHEYDPRVTGDWRHKLENQSGSVFATEIKNNMCRMQRWVVRAIAARATRLFIGFVARQSPRDPTSHLLLALENYGPAELAAQMNMNFAPGRAMLAALVRALRGAFAADPGLTEVLLLKGNAIGQLRIYRVPQEKVVAAAG